MNTRFAAILTGFLLIYGALAAYIGWNGWLLLSALTGWQSSGLYWLLLALLALGYLLGRLGQSTSLRPLAEPLKTVGAYWLGLFQYGLLILPIADAAGWLLKLAGAPRSVYLIGTGSVALLLLIAILAKGAWNAWNPIIRRYNVRIAKSAGAMRRLRIAAASDLHLGTVIGNRHIGRLLATVDEIKPDIILLPGDILDDDIEPFLRRDMAAELARLKAPLGVFAVTGNHEYIGRKVPEFVSAMDAIGIRVLMDEAAVVADSFIVVGRKDKASEGGSGGTRKSVAELVEPLQQSLPLIMLDHQPSDLGAAEAAGIDLSLSGHTHRGQMMPNHLITKRLFELDWGYLKKGNLHAIVSSGFGFWGPPIRIGSRSEVIHIEVEFGAADGS